METTFKAKDIQRLIGISKIRYEYLALKLGISPDIEQVKGTGRSHLYSYKNLIQFKLAHVAGDLGIGNVAIKRVFKFIDSIMAITSFYEPGVKINASIHCLYRGGALLLKAEGGSVPPEYRRSYELNGEGSKTISDSIFMRRDTISKEVVNQIKNTLKLVKKEDIEAYVVFNLGVMKKEIDKQL